MRPTTRQAVKALRRLFEDRALRSVFADIRKATDSELLAPSAPGPAPDMLITEVTALLAPSRASSAEKGQMLVARLEALTGRALAIKTRGLPGAVRRLRALLSEDDIRDGAFSVRVTLMDQRASQDRTIEDGKTEDAKPKDAKPKDAKPKDAKTKDAKTKDAKTKSGRTQDAET